MKRRPHWFQTFLWSLVLLTVAVTPLLVAPLARDVFRAPKTAFFHAAMLVILGGIVAWILLGRADGRRLSGNPLVVATAAATVIWTVVASLAAVDPDVSRWAPLTAFTCALAFVATLTFARGTLLPLAALLGPALINAVSTGLQDLRLWSPVRLPETLEARVNTTGLLGNPDYVAAYLIVPSVAAVCAAIAFRRYRYLFLTVFGVLLGGVLFTRSVTGVVSIAAALGSFAVTTRSRRIRSFVLVSFVLVTIGVFAYPPARSRVFRMANDAREGRWQEFSSFRLPAFAAAVSMFADDPLTGQGPGGYEARYMSYKIANDERYPQWMDLGNVNFGETHNDHLQLLAETGLPGYVLFLLGLGQLAALSFGSTPPPNERARYSRLFGLPAAVGFAVAGLAQFPMSLIACTTSSLFAAGLAFAWRTGGEDEEVEDIPEGGPLFAGASRLPAGAVAVAAIAVTCLAAYRVGWMRYRTEVVKKRAEERLYRDYSSDYERLRVARAVTSELAPYFENDPADYQTLFMMATAADNLKRKGQALTMYERALSLNQRPEIYANIAVLQLELGRADAARDNMMRAAIFNVLYVEQVADPLRGEIIVAVHDRFKRLQERAKSTS
jgi:O-antigen ligase